MPHVPRVSSVRVRKASTSLPISTHIRRHPTASTQPAVWAREGGREALIGRLKDPATRAAQAHVLRADPTWENQYLGSGGAAGLLIANLDKPELRSYQGRRLEEIGRADAKDPLDALMDLILADVSTGWGIMFMMREDDVRVALRHPLVAMGTDTGAQATDGPTATSFSHPRGWGSATRILGKYVREEGLLTLEEAVRKMTSLPATRMKLWDRGLVRLGFLADLTVFKPRNGQPIAHSSRLRKRTARECRT